MYIFSTAILVFLPYLINMQFHNYIGIIRSSPALLGAFVVLDKFVDSFLFYSFYPTINGSSMDVQLIRDIFWRYSIPIQTLQDVDLCGRIILRHRFDLLISDELIISSMSHFYLE